MPIPEPKTGASTSLIPEKVAERPQSEEAPEARPIVVSFHRYNTKECDIDTMEPRSARKALRAIRDVGMSIFTQDDFPKQLPSLAVKPINRSGEYLKLFRGLPPDMDVQELKFDRDKGRIFFSLLPGTFLVVAVKESHYETDKQRR